MVAGSGSSVVRPIACSISMVQRYEFKPVFSSFFFVLLYFFQVFLAVSIVFGGSFINTGSVTIASTFIPLNNNGVHTLQWCEHFAKYDCMHLSCNNQGA